MKTNEREISSLLEYFFKRVQNIFEIYLKDEKNNGAASEESRKLRVGSILQFYKIKDISYE